MSRTRTEIEIVSGSIGGILAMILSWDRSHSILWAILHAFFNWFYVIYFAISRDLP